VSEGFFLGGKKTRRTGGGKRHSPAGALEKKKVSPKEGPSGKTYSEDLLGKE